ncbi:TIGR03619 family F420-dependent LLM class oxidoreductase [Halorarius halobius]|uniref:TIGR03619 family F420-dependent LLM class oxidoreductase n=1 Tax=Halorarius halobius TaxID=2962671 RepID=UPI0020CFD430|nr:TIGR03619 family F420-dependent LLM class oxidoreductase [Halorarius halobius]
MTDLEVGAILPTFGDTAGPEAFRRYAETAEAAGFDAVWVGDHVTFPADIPDEYPFSPTGESWFDVSMPVFDAFEALSFVAGVTDLAVGTNACIVPYRHPVVLAKQALTLDALTDGQFTFGLAPGWLRTEFEVLDVPFEERGSRTDEFLELLERVCAEGELAFDGPHHSFQETGFYPVPEDGEPPPVLVGGKSGAAFRRVAEYGDGWTIFWDSPEAVAEAGERIGRAWADYDREGDPELMVSRGVHVGSDGPDESRLTVGEPASIAADLEAYVDAGVTRFGVTPMVQDLEAQLEQLERFGDEILPAL